MQTVGKGDEEETRRRQALEKKKRDEEETRRRQTTRRRRGGGNPQARQQLDGCGENFDRIGVDVQTLHGFDGERLSNVVAPWCRARVAWTFFGAPQLARAVQAARPRPDDWVMFGADSCKLFSHVSLDDIRQAAEEALLLAVWVGYRYLKPRKRPYDVLGFVVAQVSRSRSEAHVHAKCFLLRRLFPHGLHGHRDVRVDGKARWPYLAAIWRDRPCTTAWSTVAKSRRSICLVDV